MPTMVLDTTEHDKSMRYLLKHAMPDSVKEGLASAGRELMKDALEKTPTVPMFHTGFTKTGRKRKKRRHGRLVRGGWLRGSGSVFVDNKFIAKSPRVNNLGTPAISHRGRIPKDSHVVVVGFNTRYATRAHELPSSSDFSTPGSGPKFLESKVSAYRKKYVGMVAHSLQSGMATSILIGRHRE